jgi:predicted DCC family thiol-disulfide oxidoreductase YuxK
MALHTGFILFMEIGHFPYVNLSGLTVLLGGWAWDWLDRRRARVDRLRIYYDRDCGFCVKSCLLLREFLILPEAPIAPAQDTPRAKELLEANYSWVVIDRDDRAYLKWPAFVTLLRHSPLFGGLGRILGARLWVPIGNAVYDWVGRHRGGFGRITAALLPAREVRWIVGPFAQAFAAAFVVLLMAWNFATVKVLPDSVIRLSTPAFRIVRIDQLWNMFAPYPSRLDGWTVYPGKLEDGSEVDVLTRKPLSWERPARLGEHENIMWHTYRWRIIDPQYQGNLLFYGRYLCRDWNWRAAAGKHLLRFDMVYLQEISLPPDQVPEVKRVTAWKHECRPKEPEPGKDKENPIEKERSRPV